MKGYEKGVREGEKFKVSNLENNILKSAPNVFETVPKNTLNGRGGGFVF